MTIGRHSKRDWWLGALLLVLGLLAHDGLMASVAHAAPVVNEATTVPGHEAGHQASAPDERSPYDPAPGHPSECGTAGTTVASPGNEPERGDVAIPTFFGAERFSASEPAFAVGWSEPCWPPGVRRALLQVYRN